MARCSAALLWLLSGITLIGLAPQLFELLLLPHEGKVIDNGALATGSTGIRASSSATVCTFTISSFNNFGFVKIFFEQFRYHNPHLSCYVWVVADNDASWAKGIALANKAVDARPEWLHVVTARELQTMIDFSYLELAFRYDMQCFNTAIKPVAFKYIFHRLNATKVLFFDNDVWVMQPLAEIIDALDQYNFVITPHLTEAYPMDGLLHDERSIKLAGQFNFGFVAMARSMPVFNMLSWWISRLRYYGFAEPSSGMHFDQNWGDFIVSYFEQQEYLVLRNPRYNIAYWNFHYRGRHLHLVDGKVLYDDTPAVFMHFSGVSELEKYDLEGVSKYQTRIRMSDYPNLRPIFQAYIDLLVKGDAMQWRHVPYGFNTFDNGEEVPLKLRSYYGYILDPANQARDDARWFKQTVDWGNPFALDTKHGMPFVSWMLEGAHNLSVDADAAGWMPEFAWQIYLARPDLKANYPEPFGRDSITLLNWIETIVSREYKELGWLVTLFLKEKAARAQRAGLRKLTSPPPN